MNKPLVIVGLAVGAGVLYLIFKPEARYALENALGGALQANRQQQDYYAQQLAAQQQQQNQRIAGAIAASAAGAGALIASRSGSSTQTSGGMGGVGTAMTAGIAAGAALLTWAIVEKGLFRGGWEGVQGNDLRDKFLNQLVQVYYPGSGVEMQYEAMVRALAEIGIVGSGEPGSSVPNAGQLIKQLYEADSKEEMRAAFAAWDSVFKRAGIDLQIPAIT
jgi:hypothetical protein